PQSPFRSPRPVRAPPLTRQTLWRIDEVSKTLTTTASATTFFNATAETGRGKWCLFCEHFADHRDDLGSIEFDRMHHQLVRQAPVAILHTETGCTQGFDGVGDFARHGLR